jgi:prepilin-type N-terminal cleavage/methylation domain-containing protein
MRAGRGFTLIELLLVIVIMAIIATLAIHALINAGQQKDEAYIKATSTTLQSALMNYRVDESRWPVALDPTGTNKNIVFRNDNAKVFAPLISSSKKSYLDVSALFTKIPGKGVLTLKKALELNIPLETACLGYPEPKNRSNFIFFKVVFNIELDTVSVEP